MRIVLENAPKGKRPLGRRRLRWADRVKKYVVKVRPEMDWKELSLGREIWGLICWKTWS